jgi:hypothetical protein
MPMWPRFSSQEKNYYAQYGSDAHTYFCAPDNGNSFHGLQRLLKLEANLLTQLMSNVNNSRKLISAHPIHLHGTVLKIGVTC